MVLTAKELAGPLRSVARMALPTPYEPSANRFLREAAADLHRLELPRVPAADVRRGRKNRAEPTPNHPVSGCPDRSAHVRALDRAERLANDVERLERRIRGRSESLARQFDRVLSILERWGYVNEWTLTSRGEQLCRIYHESDLLIAECLGEGVFEGLDAPSLVALASGFTFESRGPAGTDWLPPPRHLRERIAGIESLAGELNREEELAGLLPTRTPEFGFASVAYAWAAGRQLGDVVSEETLSGGDFVRNVKSLIDLVRQLGQVAAHPETAGAARAGADALFRGVVAASSAVAGQSEENSPDPLQPAEAGA
jgi:ATP-dependent RNA helicase HelY